MSFASCTCLGITSFCLLTKSDSRVDFYAAGASVFSGVVDLGEAHVDYKYKKSKQKHHKINTVIKLIKALVLVIRFLSVKLMMNKMQRIYHLPGLLLFWVSMACLIQFQHWSWHLHQKMKEDKR